jgi:ribose transport system substrate-binding protein
MYSYAAGDKIPPVIINPDRFYDASNAKEMLASAF